MLFATRQRKLPVHKNGRFDPHEPKDIIKSQQAGNGEKAKEGVGSWSSHRHPSIDSSRMTLEALLSEGDDRFFPNHYLTKFAVVAVHSCSSGGSQSQSVTCRGGVSSGRAARNKEKIASEANKPGQMQLMAIPSKLCCVMCALFSSNMISFRPSNASRHLSLLSI